MLLGGRAERLAQNRTLDELAGWPLKVAVERATEALRNI